jgi:membrane fusion protein (multidrug efflux system)
MNDARLPDPETTPAQAPAAQNAPEAPVAMPANPTVARRYWSADVLVRLVVVVAAVAISILFATQWDRWVGDNTRQVTDDAYIRGDITPLSAKIDGYVARVAVDDFDRVKAGDLLIQIEDSDYQARVAQAEADLRAADAAIANLKARKETQHATIDEAEETIKATEADVIRTQEEAQRQRALLASTFGTRQRVEQADADEKRFAATFASKQAELAAQRHTMAVLDTQEVELRAEEKARAAALELARINLGYTHITAPVSGVVGERGVRAGQYVHAGSQVISVVPLDNVWVIANYKETQLTHVAVGQRVEIRVDTFPGIVIGAMVDSIAPASGSQFSLLPPDNATGNFTKVIQRIPVKLRIGPDNPLAGNLRPGMSVIATILTNTTPPPP